MRNNFSSPRDESKVEDPEDGESVPPSFDPHAVKWIFGITLLIAALLLFFRLGHYALWDDESYGALGAKSILATGDTKAVIGHNLLAFRNGMLIHNLRIEGEAPFIQYLIAPSLKGFGETAFAARFPLALLGLGSVGFMLWWAWKWRISSFSAAILSIALIGNVSFFLFSRQCRYYAAAMFFSLIITYLYLHRRDFWSMLAMGICSAFLMASNSIVFVPLAACLAADYLLWQRKVKPFKLSELVPLFVPMVMVGVALLAWWNPLRTSLGDRVIYQTLNDRLTLFLWHWRDLNRCEMFVGALLPFTLVFAVFAKDAWMRRALIATLVYGIVVTVVTIQRSTDTVVSDVRYFIPLLPLWIAIAAFTFRDLVRKFSLSEKIAIPLALLVFFTNLFHGGHLLPEGLRSTFVHYIKELFNPPADPYTVAWHWIEANVREGESIAVGPNYMMYPLMFHAPKAVYAWQLSTPVAKQFEPLPPIHRLGEVSPDYFILFGPIRDQAIARLQGGEFGRYELLELNTFWKPLYRPELLWRKFSPVLKFDPDKEGIYILKRDKATGKKISQES